MSSTVVVRRAHAHTLAQGAAPLRTVTVAGTRFAGDDPKGQDVVLDGLCLLPGLVDSHIHQIEACQDLDTVDLAGARSISELIGLLSDGAQSSSEGRWVVSNRGWLESRLAERRLPTSVELDRVSAHHPVMVRRGSHLGVLNGAAVELAGEMAEGDQSGKATGFIRGAESISRLIGGAISNETRAEALKRVCARHASRGLVGVRDAGIDGNDLEVYRLLDQRGELTVRTDVLIRIPPELDRHAKLAMIGDLGPPPTRTSDWLRVTGIKLYADGRIEDAAMREPYVGRSQDFGVLHMDSDEVAAIAGEAVGLGLRVGTHVVGDRALDAVLDGYERVISANPGLVDGWLVIEHALVADAAQRHRAASLGVGVTVQHPLVDWYSQSMVDHWGQARTAAASPVRGWLEAGALVAAGSDGHVTPVDPLRSISGLVDRRTVDSGIVGAEQGISLEDALRLYTVSGQWLADWRTPEEGFAPGGFADFVAFPSCAFEPAPESVLRDLEPVLTVAGGRSTFDPEGLWPAAH